MKKLINLLRGYMEWHISCAFPERMLNLCAQHRVQFWHLRWENDTAFTFRTALKDRKRVEELARRAMCDFQVLSRKGLGGSVQDLVKRWGFLAGLAICLGAVTFLSQFLLVVDVVGNERVPTAIILSELERLGVKAGAYGPRIEEVHTANEALLALPQLSYMAINIYGTRAEVIVREAVAMPELLDEETPANLVAAADGIITDLRTDAGRALFAEGDIVSRGEVLITGDMALIGPENGIRDLGKLVVRAAGSVRARTWRTLEEKIPLTVEEKVYTGVEQKQYAVKILWKRFEFFKKSSISGQACDKINCIRVFTLGGMEMPLSLEVTTLREYTLRESPLKEEDARQRLEQVLMQRLNALMDANEGEVLRTDLLTRIEGNTMIVTLLAECREEIGRTVEFSGETGFVPPGATPLP